MHDFIGEDIVPLQFIISPDLDHRANIHARERFQRLVKPRYPALLFSTQGLVVDVGITDEQMLIERHDRTLFFLNNCS